MPKNGRGIYHEKVGLFIDSNNDYIAFSGSQNESANAFENNYECIEVFQSWDKGDKIRAEKKKEHFMTLWNQTNNDCDIYEFSDAAKKKLIKQVLSNNFSLVTSKENETFDWKDTKWEHQEQAKNIFLEKKRGILNMATGTGKTKTSIKILVDLFQKDKIDTVIISMYGNSLLEQWYKEILQLRKKLNIAIFKSYQNNHEQQSFINSSTKSILISSLQNLPTVLSSIAEKKGGKMLLIYDEVHRLGAPENINSLSNLSDKIEYVLGLSATPEREYDENGNLFILKHVGPILMSFDLKDAIERNILSPFNYYPLEYTPTDEDREKIQKIRSLTYSKDSLNIPLTQEQIWTMMAQVYKSSRAKQPVFDAFIKHNKELLKRCIIFVDNMEYGFEVLEYVHKYRHDFHTYFSGDDEKTLQRFAKGDLECLVACHRLSEGIDIRSLNTVILFSSDRAKLETIQRIGRCLRTDPNNILKVANVVDFIRDESDTDLERKLWLEELSKNKARGVDYGNGLSN